MRIRILLLSLIIKVDYMCDYCYYVYNTHMCIRHINDYAVIVLMDHRYTRPKTVSLLPKWIRASLHTYIQYNDAYKDIVTFFNNKG